MVLCLAYSVTQLRKVHNVYSGPNVSQLCHNCNVLIAP
jgi:hypothetical protein